MATSGVMAEFAKMPTQRKAMVFGAIGLVIGLIYYQMVYKSLSEDLEQARNDNAQMISQDQKLAADIPKFADLRERVVELQQIISENARALPTQAEVPAFFEMLERKVTQSGVEISKWTKKPEENVETFVKVPVEIEISGTYMQIKRFFASLVQNDVAPVPGQVQERERIVSIENLSLSNPVVRNREIILNARFTAVTFRQDDAAAAAAGAVGAPIVVPSNPAAPPMPSAATPAGAKARTEDALKKGETVDRNATGVEEAKTPAGSAQLKGGL
ncbi:MAG: type 4a pilus biogenesis protein PilO [Kofleriaceae bacterium]